MRRRGDGLIRDSSDRVRGVRTRGSDGITADLTARFVVGADGLRSRVAGWVGAETIEPSVSGCSVFYAYVDEVDWQGFEFYTGSDAFAGVFPTHAGQACAWLCRATTLMVSLLAAGAGRTEAFRTALTHAVPALAERIHGGRITSQVRGAVNLPNILRRPVGNGWALVGDAGYHRDPITGHGNTDAFRDAELVARAVDASLRAARHAVPRPGHLPIGRGNPCPPPSPLAATA